MIVRKRKTARKLRAALSRAVAFAAVASVAVGLVVVSSGSSDAIPASGGNGRFVDSIQWISWGAANSVIPTSGATKTETFVAGGQTFSITCSIAPFTGDLRAYRPGSWVGDGLDDMYNIGGPGGSNTLVNGLRTGTSNTTVSFDFSCSGTVNGNALPLAGLVFADAEQSGSNAEFIAATAPVGATWRIIDRYRDAGCTQSSQATVDSSNRFTLSGDSAGTTCASGPTAVAFLDGATSATSVTLKGSGLTAIALGVMLGVDHGDAPSSYGDPSHIIQSSWMGGSGLGASPTAISENSFTLASRNPPTTRLGALVDAEDTTYSAGATADDATGTDDEDALSSPPSRAYVLPGDTYTLSSISCADSSGTAVIAAWIDWNHNGTFDSGERSTQSACTAGAASVSWTVPSDVVTAVAPTSFLRLRIGPDAASVATATGIAYGGEVEDYALEIEVPAPVTAPDSGSTQQNTASAPLNPLANDTAHPVGGAALVASSVRLMNGSTPVTSLAVSGGTYAVNTSTGYVTFTPAQGFTGTAGAVTYRVTDTNGQSSTSTISMTVTPVAPTANPDTASTSQGQAVTVDAPANDTPGNPATSIDTSSVQLTPGSGGGTPTNGGKTLVVPNEGTYQVGSNGVVTFTPVASFVGTSSIGYSIADEDGTRATSTISVSVAGVAPVAVPDTATTQQNQPVTFSPAANDLRGVSGGTPIDPTSVVLLPTSGGTLSSNGKTLTLAAGTFAVASSGDVTFTPAQGFSGAVPTANYRVSDTGGRTGDSTIDVTVTAVAPQPVNDTATTPQGSAVVFSLSGNDQPGNAQTPLVASSVVFVNPGTSGSTLSNGGKTLTIAGEGVYTVNSSGTGEITFTPVPAFAGTASTISYRISDVDGGTGTATVSVSVTPAPPLPQPDTATTQQNTPVVIRVLDNDATGIPGGSALDATTVRLLNGSTPVTSLAVSGGTFTVSTTSGVVTFTPAQGFVGTVPTVTYRVTDVHGASATSTIDVDVTAVSPTATPDSPLTDQGVTLTFDPLANDTAGNSATPLDPTTVQLATNGIAGATLSPDGRTLTVPGEGTYAVDSVTGEIEFVPVPAFSGLASTIGYAVEDVDGTATASTIQVNVAPTTLIANDDIGSGKAGDPIVIDALTNDDIGTGVPLVPGSVKLVRPNVLGAVLSTDGRTLTIPEQGTYTVSPSTGRITFLSLPTLATDPTPVAYTVEDINGVMVSATVRISIQAPTLAFTGGGAGVPLGLAGVLLLVGIALLGASSVRRAWMAA